MDGWFWDVGSERTVLEPVKVIGVRVVEQVHSKGLTFECLRQLAHYNDFYLVRQASP
jgi:hypothetical protein